MKQSMLFFSPDIMGKLNGMFNSILNDSGQVNNVQSLQHDLVIMIREESSDLQ